MVGGLTGILERASARLTSRNQQPLAHNQVGRCSNFVTHIDRARAGLDGEEPACQGLRQGQDTLWRQFFQNTSLWWDARRGMASIGSPDSRDRHSQDVLSLDNCWKPAWEDSQLAALDVKMGRMQGAGVTSVTAETVSKLCRDGRLVEAVEALEVLVRTDRGVSKSLFTNVLKKCVAKRDVGLGSRVHALVVERGYQGDTILGFHILRMYASRGRLQDAMDVFEGVENPDAFTWSAIISAHVRQRQDKQAIELYRRMRRSGVKPDGHVFVAALQACARGSDLKAGQQVHADVLAGGVEHNVFICSGLVDMYAKCGSLEDAQRVFDGLGEKDVVTWNAMIAGYSQKGRGQEALQLYSAMQEEGMAVPNAVTFVCLLQACASVGTRALEKGRQLHAQIREGGHEHDVFVASSLVNMYAKCGSLQDAQRVFDRLGQKDVVTWNAMIAGYSQEGMGQEALSLYCGMREEGIAIPDSVTFVCLLQACASVGAAALEKGKELHRQIKERRHEADVFVASSLVNMYAKCHSLEDAQRVFDGLGQKNEVTWTAMITGYSQRGMGQEALRLYNAMQEEGMSASNSVTFVCLLQACASVGTPALGKGKQLHAQIKEQGLESDVFVANTLVNMYAKCGSLEDAQDVFDGLGQKNVVTWTAIIAGYAQQGQGHEALRLYTAMQESGFAVPDSVTFVCLLQACTSVGTNALAEGKQLHRHIEELALDADVFVASSLVNMYSKCGSLEDAHSVFDRLAEKNVVTWNAMIAAYSQQGMGEEALGLYSAMQEEAITLPDCVTFLCLLQACASVGASALEKGKQLHTQIREQGYEADGSVASSLVNMYSKCGSLEDAQKVFKGLDQKNVVTWTALIAGYSQQGMGQEALRLYDAMLKEGMAVPDSMTFVCLLQACANVAGVDLGRQLHAQIVEQGLQTDVFVAGSLINMYGKSGSMVDAQEVFDTLTERNVVTWNALIAGYACKGDSEVVFDLVQKMKEDGIPPDGITFVSVLTVCSHAGLVKRGWKDFEAMSAEYGITPTEDHYTCMVDLLGRAGQLDEALALIRSMPIPADAAVWHTLLNACRKWSNVEVGRHAFSEAVKLEKTDASAYVLMSNVYTSAQMWEEAEEMQVRRKRIKAWKQQPGQSWWTDKDGLVHSFLVGDE